MQALHIGQIVQYKLSAADVEQIERRYKDASDNRSKIQEEKTGYQVHVGNPVHEGQVMPLIIVEVHSEGNVNGQVILDGNDSLWVTSVLQGDENGRWTEIPTE